MSGTRQCLKYLVNGDQSVQSLVESTGLDVKFVRAVCKHLYQYGYVKSNRGTWPMTYSITDMGRKHAATAPKSAKPIWRTGTTKTLQILSEFAERERPTGYADIISATGFEPALVFNLTRRLANKGLLRMTSRPDEKPFMFDLTDAGRAHLYPFEAPVDPMDTKTIVGHAIRTQPTSVFSLGGMYA